MAQPESSDAAAVLLQLVQSCDALEAAFAADSDAGEGERNDCWRAHHDALEALGTVNDNLQISSTVLAAVDRGSFTDALGMGSRERQQTQHVAFSLLRELHQPSASQR